MPGNFRHSKKTSQNVKFSLSKFLAKRRIQNLVNHPRHAVNNFRKKLRLRCLTKLYTSLDCNSASLLKLESKTYRKFPKNFGKPHI